MEELISIIIPVYNVEPFLDRCMESIAGQTYQNYEVLLIDDGSCDNSGQLCDSYAQKENRCRIFHQKNQGVSVARNLGLTEAKGRYIAFIDADDCVKPDYLEVLYKDIVENSADIACCNFVEFDQDQIYSVNQENHNLKVSGPGNGIKYYFDMLGKNNTPGVVWGKLMRSSLAKKHLFIEGQNYGEDTIYMFELLSEDPVIYVDSYTGYYYFRRSDSATKKSSAAAVSIAHMRIGEIITGYTDYYEETIRTAGVNEYAKRIYTALSYLIKDHSHKCYKQFQPQLVYHSCNVLKKSGIRMKYKIALISYLFVPEVYWHMMSLILRRKEKMQTGRSIYES